MIKLLSNLIILDPAHIDSLDKTTKKNDKVCFDLSLHHINFDQK